MANQFLISRDRLAAFLKDNDTIRRFERLFQVVGIENPEQIAIILKILDELSVDSGSNSSAIGGVRDSLAALAQDLDQLLSAQSPDTSGIDIAMRSIGDLITNQGSIDAKAGQIADTLASLARSLEVAVSRPGFDLPRSLSLDYLDFDQTPTFSAQTGRVGWNSADDTLNIHHSDGVTQQVGQETYGRITNNTGATIPNGVALGINPATNSYVLYIANGTLSTLNIVGVTTQQILNGQQGRITVWGRVRDIDTTGTPYGEAWAAGDILYVSTSISGGFTKVKPTAPNLSIPIAQVITVNATTGQIAVRPVIEQQLFYGQFAKTASQVPSAANTANAITWPAALISNGVAIGSPTSRIVVTNAGLYKFSTSFQLTSGSASVKNVWFWFRKNGVDIANTALVTSMDSGSAIRSPARSLLISLVAGDYVELMWASDSTNVTLDAIPATAFAPAAPAALLTVNQEQQ